MKQFSFLLLFLSAAAVGSALAEPSRETRDTLISVTPHDSIISDSARLIIRIERKEIQNRAIQDTLDVTMQAFDYPIAGFDLVIGTSSPHLQITEVLPGELSQACNWEYFTAREINTGERPGYPTSMWKAIGLAEMMPDTLKRRCYEYDSEVSLARLVVSNTHVLNMPETTAAVYFFWQDCTDNSISSQSGQKLVLSLSVLDYLQPSVEDSTTEFPTRRGHPRSCINPASKNPPVRLIEFHNGGITYSYGTGVAADSLRQVRSQQPIDSTASQDSLGHQ